MIQGSTVRLHKGSTCTIRGHGNKFAGAKCAVVAFDNEKQKWQVERQDAGQRGKLLLVPESALRFDFSLLPSSLSQLERYHQLHLESTQGTCGRGLIAGQDIAKGMPLFEEAPLLVNFSPSPLDETATPLEHHANRWRSYVTLVVQAEREAALAARTGVSTSGMWAKAVKAFDDLGIAQAVPEHVVDSARQLAEADFSANAGAFHTAEDQMAHIQHITDTLMRFHSNQFSYDNNAPEYDKDFSAKAVFLFTSRMNHSCRPNVSMVTKRAFCRHHRIQFTPETDDGVKV